MGFIGYYCCGTKTTLVAICAPTTPGGEAELSDIITVDLKSRKDRIANIRHLINLSTLLPMLASYSYATY